MRWAFSAVRGGLLTSRRISPTPASSSLVPIPAPDGVHQVLGHEGAQDRRDRGLEHAIVLHEGRRRRGQHLIYRPLTGRD
jgi:hypothetical protein